MFLAHFAAIALTLALSGQAAPTQPTPLVEELWNAARAGDVARVTKALDLTLADLRNAGEFTG